jgi:hypothetical protein
MTEYGASTASKYCGRPSAFVADFRASDSKDTSPQWMKQALVDAMSDRVPAIPKCK